MDQKPLRRRKFNVSLPCRFVRPFLLLSAGFLSTCWTFAQAQTPRTLLWQVTGKNLTRPSYLFGTMHVLCSEDARLSDSLRAAISHCDAVYFEIDLSKMSDIGTMISAVKYMRMNDNKTLSDVLSPADYSRVKDYFAHHSAAIPFGMLERFKPMLISAMLQETDMSCKTTDGMEMMIMQELHQYDNKPINGLETIEFQASLFDSIPYADQAKELVNYIDSADQYKQQAKDLAQVYKDQDLDKIDALSEKGDPGMGKYMDLLLYDRNRKWAKELDSLLVGKSLLVAVGAAHLPGENGVINLLREEGYTLTPIRN